MFYYSRFQLNLFGWVGLSIKRPLSIVQCNAKYSLQRKITEVWLTPYLHCLDCGPYWKRHCSSASCNCPGSSSEKWKSLCGGRSSKQSPAPELDKTQQTQDMTINCCSADRLSRLFNVKTLKVAASKDIEALDAVYFKKRATDKSSACYLKNSPCQASVEIKVDWGLRDV